MNDKRKFSVIDESISSKNERRKWSTAGLEAFDAAATTGSFASAAKVLSITPSAISHRIRNLETVLGVALFRRTGRTIALSEDGYKLAHWVRKGFTAFQSGVEAVRSEGRANKIRVSALALFSQTVLIPRLQEFRTRHPEYLVQIEITSHFTNFDVEDIDLAIRVGATSSPGLHLEELLKFSGTPVANPAFLELRQIQFPTDLGEDDLIHDSNQPDAWKTWLASQNVSLPQKGGGTEFDNSTATLMAAEQGIGIALAIDPLVERWPSFGQKLVRVFPGSAGPINNYSIVCQAERKNVRKIRLFSNWLQEICREQFA